MTFKKVSNLTYGGMSIVSHFSCLVSSLSSSSSLSFVSSFSSFSSIHLLSCFIICPPLSFLSPIHVSQGWGWSRYTQTYAGNNTIAYNKIHDYKVACSALFAFFTNLSSLLDKLLFCCCCLFTAKCGQHCNVVSNLAANHVLCSLLQQDLNDGGGMYMLGPQLGSVIHHNWVYHQVTNGGGGESHFFM